MGRVPRAAHMGPGDKILVRGLFGTSNEATGPKIGENRKIVGVHFRCLLHGCDVKYVNFFDLNHHILSNYYCNYQNYRSEHCNLGNL